MSSRPLLLIPLLATLLAACGKEEAPPPPATAEPAPATAEPAPAAEPAATAPPATPDAADTTPAPVADAASTGESIYKKTCAVCHATGTAGAPIPGDKTAWAPRIAQGIETLYKHSIEGYTGTKGVMPPKGGNLSLTDEEMKAAVDYMVGQSS